MPSNGPSPRRVCIFGAGVAQRTKQYQDLKADKKQTIDEIKNLLMPLFLMGCFLVDFQEVKRPLRTKSGKRPITVGKRPIKEGKRPMKAMVLVGISVGCLMGCFRAPPPWRKTAPLKRPIERSMTKAHSNFWRTSSEAPTKPRSSGKVLCIFALIAFCVFSKRLPTSMTS